MAVLCTGSIAIDHIMVFRGRFREVILPEKIHMLNVAFHVPELRKSFGGTAANIAFNLRLLGDEPILLGTVGGDFDVYASWLTRHGVALDHVARLADETTAGAYITTDLDDNQIIGFHPGAMDRAHEAPVEGVKRSFEIGIVAPNGKRAMQEHARALKARGARTVIDPGQGLPLFDGPELVELLDGAEVYVVNDYEWDLTLEKTGLDEDALARKVEAVVVTRGEKGSLLRCGDAREEIPAVKAAEVVDPTGCGDAYRAGLLWAMDRDLPLSAGARLGSLMGSLMVERHGTQSLDVDFATVRARFEQEFGAPLG